MAIYCSGFSKEITPNFYADLFPFLQLLRDHFNYKPILTKKQFLQCGFAEWKIQIICDILNCVMKKHKELSGLEKVIILIDFILCRVAIF